MKKSRIYLLQISFLWLISFVSWGQFSYKIETLAVGSYRVSMRSTQSFPVSGSQSRIASNQVTIVAPAGTAGTVGTTNAPLITNLTNQIPVSATSSTPAWRAVQRANHPTNPNLEYIFFALDNNPDVSVNGAGIPANVEIPLFTFTRSGTCLGDLRLFENASDPVTAQVNAPNSIYLFGVNSATTEAYIGNFGTVATCNPNVANLVIAKSAPASVQVNQNFDYNLVVTNNGTAATSGVITVRDPLASGLTFVSTSSSVWTCTTSVFVAPGAAPNPFATPIANGQTVVTCTTSATIPVNGSLPLPVTVRATSTGALTNQAAVVGGGDTTEIASNITSTNVQAAPPVCTVNAGVLIRVVSNN
ncbi:MAG: hypothetical protein ACK4UP_03635 [Spirosomataceae bacterium]